MTRAPEEPCPWTAHGPGGRDVGAGVRLGGAVVTIRGGERPDRPDRPDRPGRLGTITRGGVLVVVMSGEIDIAVRRRLPAVLEEVRWHPGPVEVDLEAVTFFGAEGVAALLALLHARPPGVVALAGTSRAVDFTLRACRLAPDCFTRAPRGR